MSFPIVKRDEWGASPPLWTRALDCPAKRVFFEYTKRNSCRNMDACLIEVKYLQNYNLKLNGNPDIRYNFLIGGDGIVYEGRGWWTCPRLPKEYERQSKHSLYIGLIGVFNERYPPSEIMFQARHELVKYAVANQHLLPTFLEYMLGMTG